MDKPNDERATLPNISRARFCLDMRALCEAHSYEALDLGNDLGFDDSGCLAALAVALYVEGVSHYLLRAYLRAGCNVRFQGE